MELFVSDPLTSCAALCKNVASTLSGNFRGSKLERIFLRNFLTEKKSISLDRKNGSKILKATRSGLVQRGHMERTKNFSFDEWKKRFSGWVKNQHGKLLDFYRKIDSSGSGRLTYDDFIEGFLNSKFPTCKAEMEKVAPIFDRNCLFCFFS